MPPYSGLSPWRQGACGRSVHHVFPPGEAPGRHDNQHLGADTMTQAIGLMSGKRGVIMGVANNRSIAWGIAKALRAQGAEIALTYQGDALKKRVEPLAAELGGVLAGHCDVSDEATIDAVFDHIEQLWG